VGHNLRWDTLNDFTSRDANIYAHCFLCNRTGTFDSHALARYFRRKGWHLGLTIVYQKLVCKNCGRPAGKIGPTRRLADRELPRLRRLE